MSECVTKLVSDITNNEVTVNFCKINKVFKNQKQAQTPLHSSPTAIIFADLQIRKNNDCTIPVTLKLFANAKQRSTRRQASYDHNLNTKKDTYEYEAVQGLKYEANVYKYVISEIFKNHYSPNFVRYIGFSKCNLYKSDFFSPLYEVKHNIGSNTMNILVTERITDAKSLREVENVIKEQKQDDELLFQIVYNIALLKRINLTHNDLHDDNILVKYFPKKQKLVYNVDGRLFKIRTNYVIYFFDWDLSYSDDIGDNPKIKHGWSETMIQNKLNWKYDLYRILCYLNSEDINVSDLSDKIGDIDDKHQRIKENNYLVNLRIPITKQQNDMIVKKYRKDVGLLKISSFNLKDILGSKKYDQHFSQRIKNHYFMIEIDEYDENFPYKLIFPSLTCSPPADIILPSPVEILVSPQFSRFEINKAKEKYKIYTLPKQRKIKRIKG
jgi:hypothetical protein